MTDFKCVELGAGIYQLQDIKENCATLVVGESKALLFDTMLGVGDLKGFISQLTNLPMIVVNSHGHFDHMGNNCQFEEVYLSKKDWHILPIMIDNIPEAERTNKLELNNLRNSLENTEYLRDVEPGMEFDLGGITARVVALPGHTGGSIGLLLVERRILLAGDAATPQMCLFMDGRQPLEVYQDTLSYMMTLEFDYFVLGHFQRLFPKYLLDNFMECTKVVGKKKGFPLVYQQLPVYHGTVYFYEMRNEEIDDAICIIIKED